MTARIGIPTIAPHEFQAVRSGEVTTVTGVARRNLEIRATVQGTGNVVTGRTGAAGATIEVQDGPVSGSGHGHVGTVTVEGKQADDVATSTDEVTGPDSGIGERGDGGEPVTADPRPDTTDPPEPGRDRPRLHPRHRW